MQRPALLQAYLEDATAKIVVAVTSEEALERVEREAAAASIPHQSVRDAGRSEIEPGTKTGCLFGPAYRDELPSYLRRLRTLSNDQFTAGIAEASKYSVLYPYRPTKSVGVAIREWQAYQSENFLAFLYPSVDLPSYHLARSDWPVLPPR